MTVKRKKVTRQDVADAAGVSKAVVTWVKQGTAKKEHCISDATIKKVSEIGEKMRYSPSIWGKLINTQKSGIIAVVSSDLTDPAAAKFVRAVNVAAEKRNYKMALFDMARKKDINKLALKDFEDGLAEAFIIDAPTDSTLEYFLPEAEAGAAYCVRGRDMSGTAFASVEIDNFEGSRMALSHLLTDKPETIGIISDFTDIVYTRERIKAIEKLMLDVPGTQFIFYYRNRNENQFETGGCAVDQWLKEKKIPDGIFALGDAIALGAMSRLAEHKIPIPEAVKVVGFDGTIYAQYASPPLTTVLQPFEKMAEVAVDICIKLANGEKVNCKNLRFKPKLLTRMSSMKNFKR